MAAENVAIVTFDSAHCISEFILLIRLTNYICIAFLTL